MNYTVIDDEDSFGFFLPRFKASEFLVFDTEFNRTGKTYWPELGLLQIALSSGEIFIIDPLKVSLEGTKDLIMNKEQLKIGHSIYQDLCVFYNLFGSIPLPIFDTQEVCFALGYGASFGYDNMVRVFLDIEVSKSEQYQDWLKRPLRKEALDYAAYDVFYILKIFPRMLELLEKDPDKTKVFEKRMSKLVQFKPVDLNKRWKALKPNAPFNTAKLERLKELMLYRETCAQDRDIHPYLLCNDIQLRRICLSRLTNEEVHAKVNELFHK